MQIKVGGVAKEYPEGLTVKGLIGLEKVETPEYVTVAVNDEFVETADVESRVLAAGDSVEFLYFMGGGRG
jgi:sulfur carrier protein